MQADENVLDFRRKSEIPSVRREFFSFSFEIFVPRVHKDFRHHKDWPDGEEKYIGTVLPVVYISSQVDIAKSTW